MASMSVRDRAKLFGGLASKNNQSHESPRRREFGNNVVSSSPFLAGNSPKSTASGPVPTTFSSMSPRAGPLPTSVYAASPKSAVSVPTQRKEWPVSTYGNFRNGSPVHGRGASPRMSSPAPRNDIELSDEDSIPAPSRSVVSNKKSSYRSERKVDHPDYMMKPVVLPTSPSPLNFPPQSPSWNGMKVASPLKSLQNDQERTNFKSPRASSSPGKIVSATSQTFARKERHVMHVQSKQHTVKETVEITNLQEKRSVTEVPSGDLSNGGSFVSDSENNVPGSDPGVKGKSKRMMRLMKARRAMSPAPTTEPMLKNTISTTKAGMEEDKSSSGLSIASSESSLSNKELSEIASRATKLVGGSNSVSPVEEERPGSVRGMRTISKVSHQEARLALLNAAKKKNQEDAKDTIQQHGATKAKKTPGNESKDGNTNLGLTASMSSDSQRSRRVEHPAFAGRASPKPKARVSSTDIMSSFRQFNSIRTNTTKQPTAEKKKDTATRKSMESNQSSSNKFYLPAAKALTDALNRDTVPTPKKKKEPTGSSKHDRLSMDSAGEHSMASESSFLDQADTMHSHSMKPEDNTMHGSVHQDESMHSMTERQYLDGFYQMGNIQITSNNNKAANEAYLSSLSTNTFSNASIMSQSFASTMKTPASRQNQGEKVAFLLEPTPEYSNQTMKSEMLIGLSPGPSNRSGRSFANSIVSASPCSAAPTSPAFDADFDAHFNKPNKSLDENSDKDSAELVDAAIDAAMDDILKEDTAFENDAFFAGISKAPVERKVKTIDPPKETIVPTTIVSPKKRVVGTKSVSILPNASGRSNSPPGFIFNDSEESDAIVPPDPAEDGFGGVDDIFADFEDAKEFEDTNDNSDNSDQSFGAELRQGLLKVDSSLEFPTDFDAFPEKKEVGEKQGSTSTKQTVSTSIRTGFSSIQNEPQYEGSSSIRTGLSGIQDSQDKSNSFRAENSAFAPLQTKADKESFKEPKAKFLPDTIQEETESKMVELKEDQTSFSDLKSKDEQSSFSGLNRKSTSTTDGSSESRSDSGASASSDPASSFSGQYTGYETPGDQLNDEKEPLFKNLLPPIDTDDEASSKEKGLGLLSPASRKSGSSPWKGGNFGKRVGDAIKNVLAKASPRAASSSTPSNHGINSGLMSAKNQESRSLFSSVDDDDDIFGGLEDDNTTIEEQAKIVAPAPKTPKTPKDTAKTPKQRNSKDVSTKKETSRSTRSSKLAAINAIKPPKTDTRLSSTIKVPSNILSKKHHTVKSSSPSSDPASMYSDRSGGPISTPTNPPKAEKVIIDGIEEKEKHDMRSPTTKSKSSKKSRSSKHSSKSDKKSIKSKVEMPKDEVLPEIHLAEEEEEELPKSSVFMRLSCGGLADLSSGFASLCTQSNKVDDLADLNEPEIVKDNTSVSSHSRLTDLEKKVWSEWDRLNGSVANDKAMEDEKEGPSPAPTPKPKVKPAEIKNEIQPEQKEKHEDREKKREAARDKLLDIASTAMSSHLSGKTGVSTPTISDKEDQTTLITNDILSASESSESGVTKDTGSGESGGSATASGTESGDSAGSSSSQEYTNCSSADYSSGIESDFMSEDPSHSSSTKSPGPAVPTPSAGPILLSFSQRSLMEKFSKQLTALGVQVLKLNRRNQWQVRFFTVSKEQIALSAHEAISKTGELAYCPKALLWLKKFNPKNGGYGISNIDKDGHGGMLLVDLVEIQVSDGKADMVAHPLPKKLGDKFKNSVLVTLQYKMNGTLRSIEFRCKDNDEAQFLCTCMRVIRDLLRRERSLRQKANKLERKKMTSANTTASA